jgi:hypothetical protein
VPARHPEPGRGGPPGVRRCPHVLWRGILLYPFTSRHICIILGFGSLDDDNSESIIERFNNIALVHHDQFTSSVCAEMLGEADDGDGYFTHDWAIREVVGSCQASATCTMREMLKMSSFLGMMLANNPTYALATSATVIPNSGILVRDQSMCASSAQKLVMHDLSSL